MLGPDAKPVREIKGDAKPGRNMWKASNEIYPTAVASFVASYVLNIGDRHQSNMLLVNGCEFANIDFGWLEDGPFPDAGAFAIPEGLGQLFSSSRKWDEFHDLTWDALCVLRDNHALITQHWREALRRRKVNDGFLADEVPERWRQRLCIERRELDEKLRNTGGFSRWLKNSTHDFGQKRKQKPAQKLQAVSSRASADEPEPEPAPAPAPEPAPLRQPSSSPSPLLRTQTQGLSLDAWLDRYHLSRYAAAMKAVGYDELRFVLDADAAAVDELAEQVQMLSPHRPTFRKAWQEWSTTAPEPEAAAQATAQQSRQSWKKQEAEAAEVEPEPESQPEPEPDAEPEPESEPQSIGFDASLMFGDPN
eukprot:COSAG04_NODE_2569_length_3913_cov_2.620346_1_plen_363_part_00